jgi:GNAT superfamily N-acetyltransferase
MHSLEQAEQHLGVRIRAFDEQDYDGVVRVSNACFPDAPTTVDEWRYDDTHLDRSRYHLERHVAVDERGDVVSYTGLGHITWNFHPQKFFAEVRVHPRHRRRGIGTALWDMLLASLRAHDAIVARTQIREDRAAGVHFAEQHGFQEVMRGWESRLPVAAFEFDRFQPAVDRVLASGVGITTLAAELARDPANLRRVYEMDQEIGTDVPMPDRFTPDFENFVDHAVRSPWALNDAYFIAVVDGTYAGVSALFKPQGGDWLQQGLTGVRRPFRGRGIATALKVTTISYARTHGVPEVRTWNEINNAPILAINTKFGFVRQPAWVTYARTF